MVGGPIKAVFWACGNASLFMEDFVLVVLVVFDGRWSFNFAAAGVVLHSSALSAPAPDEVDGICGE